MPFNTHLFLLLGVILALPYAVWRLANLRAWMPLVVVQIGCGIALGPGVLGQWSPEWHASLFPTTIMTALQGLALWAVALFVFAAGLELDFKGVTLNARDAVVTAGWAFAVPALLGGVVALVIAYVLPDWVGAHAGPMGFALGVGLACAVTALPILVLLLEQLGIYQSALGQRVLRYASFDDLVVWAALAAILLDTERLGYQLSFIVGFGLCGAIMRRVMARLPTADRWPAALVWLALSALAAEVAGLHAMVGAFLAGAALEAQWLGEARVQQFRGTVLLVLMPVFFINTGLRTEWHGGGPAVLLVALLLLAAAVAGKYLGVAAAARVLHWPRGEAWVIAVLLQTKALIMIIFANVMLERGLIGGNMFTALLLMALASTALTMPLVRGPLKRLGRPRTDPVSQLVQ